MDVKDAIKYSMKNAGISVTEMASKLDVTKQSVSNTLNRDTAISVQKTIQMLNMAGYELVVRKSGEGSRVIEGEMIITLKCDKSEML